MVSNDTVHLPQRLMRRRNLKSRNAAAVRCNGWFWLLRHNLKDTRRVVEVVFDQLGNYLEPGSRLDELGEEIRVHPVGVGPLPERRLHCLSSPPIREPAMSA